MEAELKMNQYRNILTGRLYNLYKVTPPKYTGGWYEMVDVVTGEIKRVDEIEFKTDHIQEVIGQDSRIFCPKCGCHIENGAKLRIDEKGTVHERVASHWECSHCGQKGDAIYELRAIVIPKKKSNKKTKKSEKDKE